MLYKFDLWLEKCYKTQPTPKDGAIQFATIISSLVRRETASKEPQSCLLIYSRYLPHGGMAWTHLQPNVIPGWGLLEICKVAFKYFVIAYITYVSYLSKNQSAGVYQTHDLFSFRKNIMWPNKMKHLQIGQLFCSALYSDIHPTIGYSFLLENISNVVVSTPYSTIQAFEFGAMDSCLS